jgi:adipocyte plasma membrane-associated protein
MIFNYYRYWLKGPKKGKAEVFVDGLPGAPDNMHLSKSGLFEVSLAMPRSKEQPMLSDTLSSYPWIRRFILRLIHYIELPFAKIQELYPNMYTGILTHLVTFS